MVCTVELLHIAPLFALVFTHLSGLSLQPKNLLASLLSVIGLAGGTHMHIDHGIVYSIFDPCVVYSITFTVSIMTIVKASFVSDSVK